jgi:hypothetical protein
VSDAENARARQKVEENLARLAHASRAFNSTVRNEAHVIMRDLIDPKGESVMSLVDGERSAGAAALLLPMDLITFDTWILGQIGDREELDLDVNTHKEIWFGLGAWVGETLRERHGGFWLLVGDDPLKWRIGFSKILLEIGPHAFAEKLLRSGEGLGKRMVGEIERIRTLHDQAKQAKAAEGHKLKDQYGPQHYARLHTVPLAQWMVLDLARAHKLWAQAPVKELRAAVAEAGKKLPPQNAAVLGKMDEAFGKLDQDKPTAAQSPDRGLFEAVAQVVALRRATNPVAIDMLEKLVLPSLHIGLPKEFPPLGDDDIANIRKGADLYAVFVDTVPYAHQAEEGGFLGTFAPNDMTTPYPDRHNLELGKGDWVAVNPARIKPMLDSFDGQRLVARYDAFVAYVRSQPNVPRIPDAGKNLAEGVARSLNELKACVLALGEGQALVFRLLPPPG